MATLDDIRNAGYDVRLAWEGDPAVYALSRATPPDDMGVSQNSLSYLPDDPDTLDSFLAAASEATE